MLIKRSNITIRNATSKDAAILCKWWNDGAVMAHAGFPNGLGISEDSIKKNIAENKEDVFYNLIIEIDKEPIGEMNYSNIGDGIAEIGIKICEVSKQEHGYGKKILSLFIDALFKDLGYKKIILDTNLDNLRAQHLYDKLGFKKVRVNVDTWTNQLGELQSCVDYELEEKDFRPFFNSDEDK